MRVPLWRIIDRDYGRGFFACKGLLGTRAVLSVVLWGSYRKGKCGRGWLGRIVRYESCVECCFVGIIQKGQMWQGLVVEDC